MKTDKDLIAPAPAREIPKPPAGGSWRFDEAAWAWVANSPATEAWQKKEQAALTPADDQPTAQMSESQE